MPIDSHHVLPGTSHRVTPAIVILGGPTLLRTLLRDALAEGLKGASVVDAAALDQLRIDGQHGVDLVLLYPEPEGSGLGDRTLEDLHGIAPVMLIHDEIDDAFVRESLRRGVKGVISTDAPSKILLAAVQLVLAGGIYYPTPIDSPADGATWRGVRAPPEPEPKDGAAHDVTAHHGLTAKESAVLEGLCRGHSNKMIARELSISENTAKMHVRRILAKLRVKNRIEAALLVNSAARDSSDRTSR